MSLLERDPILILRFKAIQIPPCPRVSYYHSVKKLCHFQAASNTYCAHQGVKHTACRAILASSLDYWRVTGSWETRSAENLGLLGSSGHGARQVKADTMSAVLQLLRSLPLPWCQLLGCWSHCCVLCARAELGVGAEAVLCPPCQSWTCHCVPWAGSGSQGAPWFGFGPGHKASFTPLVYTI